MRVRLTIRSSFRKEAYPRESHRAGCPARISATTPRFREAERVSLTWSWEQGCHPAYHDRWLGARLPRDSGSGAMRRAMKPLPKPPASRSRRYGREGVRPRPRRRIGSLLYQAPQPCAATFLLYCCADLSAQVFCLPKANTSSVDLHRAVSTIVPATVPHAPLTPPSPRIVPSRKRAGISQGEGVKRRAQS
jgi:hypothetical protein